MMHAWARHFGAAALFVGLPLLLGGAGCSSSPSGIDTDAGTLSTHDASRRSDSGHSAIGSEAGDASGVGDAAEVGDGAKVGDAAKLGDAATVGDSGPVWGFTTTEFDGLVAEVESLNQLGSLVQEVQAAQALVTATPSLIADATTRSGFIAQDATSAAASMCTTVARYMYLSAYAILSPAASKAVPTRFRDYYITVVDKGYVGTCSTCSSTYVWVNDGTSMISDFVTAPVNEWEYDRGTTYPTDETLIAATKARGPQITLFRDGPNSTTSSHTFLVALEQDGTYGMLDTYFVSTWNGKSIDDGTRFGPTGSRYLFSTYGYLATETH